MEMRVRITHRNEEPYKAKRAAIIAVCFAGSYKMHVYSNFV